MPPLEGKAFVKGVECLRPFAGRKVQGIGKVEAPGMVIKGWEFWGHLT